jgi:uncharacterized membrane protein
VEELFERSALAIALGVEAVAAFIIAIGAVEALSRILAFWRRLSLGEKKTVWLHFASWLILGLEFELAADIIRTAISPSWDDIGQLGAIALIRTFLNYFLGRDLEKAAAAEGRPVIK